MKNPTKHVAWAVIGLGIAAGMVGCGDNSTVQEGKPPDPMASSKDTRNLPNSASSSAPEQRTQPVDPRLGGGDTRGGAK